MRKEDVFGFGHAAYMQQILDTQVTEEHERPEIQERHDPKEAFLKLVYAIDERTKLPTGDLSYMVSDKANPEVKQWVLDNLMIDTSAAVTPHHVTGLSDDDIAALSRDPRESVQDYVERVNEYMLKNKEAYERMVANVRKSMESSTEPDVPVDA